MPLQYIILLDCKYKIILVVLSQTKIQCKYCLMKQILLFPPGVPLVFESYSWQHGVMVGACVKSESTAAAEHTGMLP